MIKVVSASAALVLAVVGGVHRSESDEVLARVDHLVYATPDLQAGVDRAEKLLGIRAAPGGRHPGRGTRNALIALGPASYLEIMAPDPDQDAPTEPRWFDVDALPQPRLV